MLFENAVKILSKYGNIKQPFSDMANCEFPHGRRIMVFKRKKGKQQGTVKEVGVWYHESRLWYKRAKTLANALSLAMQRTVDLKLPAWGNVRLANLWPVVNGRLQDKVRKVLISSAYTLGGYPHCDVVGAQAEALFDEALNGNQDAARMLMDKFCDGELKLTVKVATAPDGSNVWLPEQGDNHAV